MIELHWSWLVFIPVMIVFIIGIFVVDKNSSGPAAGLGAFLLLMCFIAFIAIWGGIFWW